MCTHGGVELVTMANQDFSTAHLHLKGSNRPLCDEAMGGCSNCCDWLVRVVRCGLECTADICGFQDGHFYCKPHFYHLQRLVLPQVSGIPRHLVLSRSQHHGTNRDHITTIIHLRVTDRRQAFEPSVQPSTGDDSMLNLQNDLMTKQGTSTRHLSAASLLSVLGYFEHSATMSYLSSANALQTSQILHQSRAGDQGLVEPRCANCDEQSIHLSFMRSITNFLSFLQLPTYTHVHPTPTVPHQLMIRHPARIADR